jgi:integrase
MDLLLFTGLRRSDVYKIGPQHIRDGVIEYRASKNEEMTYSPVHPTLAMILESHQRTHMAYLVTPVHRRPLGNRFANVCTEAGVDGRAHGLRKTLATILAEAGNSNSELKARFGWKSDAMANLYTRSANKRQLAITGAEKLNENILTPHLNSVRGKPKKRLSQINILQNEWRPLQMYEK